ncbi:MAG: MFS transporter [Kiritimatiellae bacterium]|nr:MFS transporter [Kiritimatiellia bacterium]
MKLLPFFKPAPHRPVTGTREAQARDYRRSRQQAVFVMVTVYGLYYVCRLSLNVMKKPLVDSGYLTTEQLGYIGSALFFAYAVGKCLNGFLADRSDIRKFMAVGLFVSALANFALGFRMPALLFAALWGINGYAQSMGAPASVVGLARWFSNRERGTYYGIWCTSHNLGEALTFILTSLIVSSFGWQWGFAGAALFGFVGAVLAWALYRDSPQSRGLPSIADWSGETLSPEEAKEHESVGAGQKAVLTNWAVWMIALASAFIYVSRYAINSWGIYFLEMKKGYSNLEASSIISVNAMFGLFGTLFSGVISDKLFDGRRNAPALIFGVMNTVALCLFLLVPGAHKWVDVVAMVLFGTSIGVLFCFLGGLMAVDVAPKNAAGAALGVVGIASYLGAGIQDIVSGYLIKSQGTGEGGKKVYEFAHTVFHFNGSAYAVDHIALFWIGASLLSLLCALTVWNVKPRE